MNPPSYFASGNYDAPPIPVSSSSDKQSKPPVSGYWDLFKQHWHAVLTYCAVYFSLGTGAAFLGPTIHDLGCMIEEDDKTMAWLFTAQMIMAFGGTIFSGWMVARTAPHVMLLVAATVFPVTMALIPVLHHVAPVAVVMAIMGFKMGVVDNICNLLMVQRFQEQITPFMQLLYFSFGLGGFVSPLISEPFLLDRDCSYLIDKIKGIDRAVEHGHKPPDLNSTQHARLLLHEIQDSLRVQYAYWIMAACMVPVPFIILALLVKERTALKKETAENPNTQPDGWNPKKIFVASMQAVSTDAEAWRAEVERERCCGASATCLVVALTVTTALFGFIYDGYQYGFGNYIFTYAVKGELHLNTSHAAGVNSVFWGVTAIGRLISAAAAIKLTPACILLIDIVGSSISITLMLAFRSSLEMLYLGTTLFALFMSSTVPTAISLLRRFIAISPGSLTVIILFCSLGETIFPVVIGNIMVDLGTLTLLATGCFVSALGCLLYFTEMVVGTQSKTYADRGTFFFVRHTSREEETLVQDSYPFYSKFENSESAYEMTGSSPDNTTTGQGS